MIEFILKIFGNAYITGFVTIFAAILSVYGVLSAWRFRRISYRRQDNVWKNAEKNFGELQILTKQDVSEVYVARYAIWNSGTKYINDFDMAPKGPIRVVAQNTAKLLDARIVTITDEYNEVLCIKENDTNIRISFDFLNPGDGAIVEVAYSGEANDIFLSGRIKGGKIKNSYSVIERLAKRRWIYRILTSKLMSFVVIAYAFVLCPIAFLQSANYDAIPNNFLGIPDSLSAYIFDRVWVISLIIFSIATAVPFIMRLFCPRLPDKLKVSGF